MTSKPRERSESPSPKHLQNFVLPPESVQEQFEGLPTLYNASHTLAGKRRLPSQRIISESSDSDSSEEDVVFMKIQRNDYDIRDFIRNTLYDVIYHPWIRYWFAVLAIFFCVDIGSVFAYIIWFLLGFTLCLIGCVAVWKGGPEVFSRQSVQEKETKAVSSISTVKILPPKPVKTHKSEVMPQIADKTHDDMQWENRWKSQGWLLTLPIDPKNPFPQYEPASKHLRNLRPVFVQLSGSHLTISTPERKLKIPKRRLWNDPPLQTEIIFIRKEQYDINGAKVKICPERLSTTRTWNKKYPIGITFTKASKFCCNGCPEERKRSSTPGKTSSKTNISIGAGVGGESGKIEVDKSCIGKTIYLFVRCDRAKDDWYRRFLFASKFSSKQDVFRHNLKRFQETSYFLAFMHQACPSMYISPLLTIPSPSSPRTTAYGPMFEPVSLHHLREPLQEDSTNLSNPMFLNALLGRILYDFHRSDVWRDKLIEMINKKISYTRIPPYVQKLGVRTLEFGESLPIISHASKPMMDQQGLWIDLDIRYAETKSNVLIAFETSLDFTQADIPHQDSLIEVTAPLEEKSGQDKSNNTVVSISKNLPKPRAIPAIYDDEAGDSGESSDSDSDDVDSEEVKETTSQPNLNNKKSFKQMATRSLLKIPPVQRLLTGIAKQTFSLTVEIRQVAGTLAINIAPVPTDRIWVGFRNNPLVDIKVKAHVNRYEVVFGRLANWIRNKILLEFQRALVCPNMLDIAVPIMDSDLPK